VERKALQEFGERDEVRVPRRRLLRAPAEVEIERKDQLVELPGGVLLTAGAGTSRAAACAPEVPFEVPTRADLTSIRRTSNEL
jgi:hypothetical protein